MDDKHDIVAFIGLAVCGLIAASLGSSRVDRLRQLSALQQHHGCCAGSCAALIPRLPRARN